jgi:hypothetical protein
MWALPVSPYLLLGQQSNPTNPCNLIGQLSLGTKHQHGRA